MIVQCQQCSTKFRLDDGRVTEAGVKVRCSKCRHLFVVRKEVSEEEPFIGEPVAAPAIVEPAPAPEPQAAPPVATESDAPAPEQSIAPLGFTEVEEPPPGLSTETEDLHFGEPAEEVAGSYFEVHYPPPKEDDFDFSDFELKIDEEEPAEEKPATDDSFDFGEFGVAERQDGHEFEILPATEEADFSFEQAVKPVEETAGSTLPAPAIEADQTPEAEPFDFGVVVAEEPAEPTTPPPLSTAVTAEPDQETPAQDGPQADELPPFVMSRRQSSSFFPVAVTALAVVFVLVMAGAGVFFLKEGPEGFNRLGLGFIPKWFGAEQKEEGKIALRKIEASFVKNAEAGEVFVIRGEAVNEYKKPRASIQVKGIVYGKNGAEVRQKTIYCGNSISTELISALPVAKIDATMNNQFGDSLSNLGVAPGKSIPFVIVMTNVPEDASDYGVEVAGSTVASQQ